MRILIALSEASIGYPWRSIPTNARSDPRPQVYGQHVAPCGAYEFVRKSDVFRYRIG